MIGSKNFFSFMRKHGLSPNIINKKLKVLRKDNRVFIGQHGERNGQKTRSKFDENIKRKPSLVKMCRLISFTENMFKWSRYS